MDYQVEYNVGFAELHLCENFVDFYESTFEIVKQMLETAELNLDATHAFFVCMKNYTIDTVSVPFYSIVIVVISVIKILGIIFLK